MSFLRDLRFGFRILRRNPSYALAAVAVVTLGIGATTAVFSVVRGVLLQPLPYREPSRLVLFRADAPGYTRQAALNSDELFALRDRSDLFESVAVINQSEGNLTSPETMAAVTAVSGSDNFLDTLGIKPLIGRFVNRGDVGTQYVTAVDISYEIWQRYFQADPQIVGRRIEINNLPMTVVGVMPRDFRLYLGSGVYLPWRVDVWYPRAAGYDTDPFRGKVVIARLRSGVSLDAARVAVDALAKQIVAEHTASDVTGPVRLSLTPIDEAVASDVKPALTAVAGAVAFVLLVACANLTNLLLARASSRTREIAVRVSIGASRLQIVRQLVAEGLVVGVIGAVAGLVLARWCVEALVLLAPATLPRREAIIVDAPVAWFAVLVSLISTVLVSLVPAWQATRPEVSGMLKQDPVTSRKAAVTRGFLMASQLALSLVLLVGAGLMLRAFVGLRSTSLGFDPHHAGSMSVALQLQRFGTGSLEEARLARLAFYRQLSAAVREIPGVQLAGVGLPAPLSSRSAFISQRYRLTPDDPERQAEGVIALAGYLEALQVPLVAGRYFTVDDDDRPRAILDERLAAELWPGQNAIGRQLFLPRTASPMIAVDVVGVVRHVQMRELRSAGLPQIWTTYAVRQYSGLSVVFRAANPSALMPAVEQAVQKLGPGRPVHDVRLLDDYVADASSDTRFALFVLGAFAALAIVLSGIGVYGMVAYATARRTREIALRLALGADARTIVTLVVRDGAVWIACGVVAGVLGAAALSRYLSSLLYNVGQRDPATFAAVVTLIAATAVIATIVPARRAVRVDPMVALREE